MRCRRWVGRGVLAVAAGVALASCVVPRETAGCRNPATPVVAALEAGFEEPTLLAKVQEHDADDGVVFVSGRQAELDPDTGALDDSGGDIYTWAYAGGDDRSFAAVDRHARAQTTFPDSDLDVRHRGAVESRGCVTEHP